MLMSFIQLQWREPTPDLCILVGIINVAAPYGAVAVGIVAAEVDRLRKCSLGHDARGYLPCVEIVEKYRKLMGEFTKPLFRQS